MFTIPLAVRLDLRFPIGEPGFWKVPVAAGMAVPETPVHEYGLPSTWKGKVGFAWEILRTDPISKTEAVERLAQ